MTAAEKWYERPNPVGPYYCGPRPHPDHEGCEQTAEEGARAALERLADRAWRTAADAEGRERVHEDRAAVLGALVDRSDR